MKRYLIFLCLTIPLLVSGQSLEVLRSKYPRATTDLQTADSLIESFSGMTEMDNPTLVAYKGALLTLKAKFSKSVKMKKSYFVDGASLLEEAIFNAPDNIEIRCLRLGVQENSPKIVKYKSNISEDKQFLLDHYPLVKNKKIRAFIKGYVLNSTLFSNTEKQLF